VVLGWETDQSSWEAALRRGLDQPTLVQARATVAFEEFPRLNERGQVEIGRRLVDCNPFLFHGYRVEGSLTRLSTATLLNSAPGDGSVTPAFIVDPK